MINTPARGIGKTTIDMIERLALETGLSMWGALGEAITRQLLPARSLAALQSFRTLVEDGRAMLSGTFAEHLHENAGVPSGEHVAELSAQNGERYAAAPPAASGSEDDTDFNPGNFSFDFGPNESEMTETVVDPPNAARANEDRANEDLPTDEAMPGVEPAVSDAADQAVEGFRVPGGVANTAELLKFLIDRTGYIKQLEEEDTPEAYSRIENLRELVNAAMDSRDRGETLDQFLDHAALVSDADQYDESAQITLMTLHAAKGLEFPLVVLAGMEEGAVPPFAHDA